MPCCQHRETIRQTKTSARSIRSFVRFVIVRARALLFYFWQLKTLERIENRFLSECIYLCALPLPVAHPIACVRIESCHHLRVDVRIEAAITLFSTLKSIRKR